RVVGPRVRGVAVAVPAVTVTAITQPVAQAEPTVAVAAIAAVATVVVSPGVVRPGVVGAGVVRPGHASPRHVSATAATTASPTLGVRAGSERQQGDSREDRQDAFHEPQPFSKGARRTRLAEVRVSPCRQPSHYTGAGGGGRSRRLAAHHVRQRLEDAIGL